jgi:hypothetical protein
MFGGGAVNLANLRAKLSLDNKEYEAGLNRSKQITGKIALGLITAFAGVSAAIAKIIKDTTVFASEMRAFAKATNLPVEELEELSYAAIQEHASMETLTRGFKNLTIRMDMAGKGMQTYIEYFDALGLQYKNSDGTLRNVKDVFLDLSDAISHSKLTTEQQAAAIQLLGSRAGQELLPMLRKGKQWFKEMADEAERVGYVIKKEDIEALKRFDDKMLALKTSVNAAKREFALGLLPALNFFTDEMKKAEGGSEDFRDTLKEVGNWVGKFSVFLADTIRLVRAAMAKQIEYTALAFEKLLSPLVFLPGKAGEAMRNLRDSMKALKEGANEQATALMSAESWMSKFEKSLKETKKSADGASGSPKGEFPGGGINGLNDELKKLLEKPEFKFKFTWEMSEEELNQITPAMQEHIDFINKNYPIKPFEDEGIKKMRDAAALIGDIGKEHTDLERIIEENAESAGELFGTYIKEGGNALAMLKKLIGQQIRLNLLSKFGWQGQFLGGLMQVFGFQEGGVVPRNMPLLNMAVMNENPRRPETAFRTPKGDTAVIPWDKLPQMVKVETYVTNANPDTQVRTLIKANPDAMDELWRHGVYPAMRRDGFR